MVLVYQNFSVFRSVFEDWLKRHTDMELNSYEPKSDNFIGYRVHWKLTNFSFHLRKDVDGNYSLEILDEENQIYFLKNPHKLSHYGS